MSEDDFYSLTEGDWPYEEPDDPFYFDEGETDPRVNPCPDCPYGEVLSAHSMGVVDYICSDGCGWSA